MNNTPIEVLVSGKVRTIDPRGRYCIDCAHMVGLRCSLFGVEFTHAAPSRPAVCLGAEGDRRAQVRLLEEFGRRVSQ